ncbi:hypothetical protein BDY21DRAFT_377801 [Lineolata rhizophorae]|uniref:Uncharacterized protein n=1 Tax=Lineolata rhizophorae TaxID=578093 RepID=A0A6A6P5Z0_9PEZI|nr:hypothetical protein BDY21DRAFT_377801 [Lineolata rhizophorae]
MSNHPTLINLPPPPSDPVTPSDIPGTPNSGTTTMSELSTVAIKDGHRGHLPHHAHPSDAERADRISRLAGLERVATARNANLAPGASGSSGYGGTMSGAGGYSGGAGGGGFGASAHGGHGASPAFFDASNNPALARERSTVGSASATGSVGGRTTTWASGSDDPFDGDKMSEDTAPMTSGERDMEDGASTSAVGDAGEPDLHDRGDVLMDRDIDASSAGGFSDEAGSLVGFGEGARTPARAQSALGSPVVGKSTIPAYLRAAAVGASPIGAGAPLEPASAATQHHYQHQHQHQHQPPSPMTGVSSTSAASSDAVAAARNDARMIDGMTYDSGVVDTADRTPPIASGGGSGDATAAERMARARLEREAKGMGEAE